LFLLAAILVRPPHAAAQQPSAAPQDTAGQATIKTTVRQVLVDVVVTDRKNHPITGLQREDFYALEDGVPQRILYFEAHSPLADAPAEKSVERPNLPANTFANSSGANKYSPLNVLLYDLLNTPLTDQPFAHREIVRFLQNRTGGGRFAIFVLSDTLHLLQGFTDDERQLVAAMQGKEARPHSTLFYQASGDASNASEQFAEGAAFANDSAAQNMAGRLQHMEELSRRFFVERRIEKTIGAFAEIANFLSGLPGRKNLIWLSGSFPANIFPGNDPLDVFGAWAGNRRDLKQVADLLTVGQVAVYPVDIRGLTTDPFFDASANYRSPADFYREHMNFILQIAAEQDTMDQIAQDTGGHAFYNTNGLSDAIATSTEDGANYYTLSYAPSNTNFNGRLRKIRIHLIHSNYHLTYRHSYLADDRVMEQNAAHAPTMMQVALRRGAPLAQELSLRVHITPLGKPKPATKEEIAELAQYPAFASRKKGAVPKVQRYSIDYALEGSQISLETAGDSGPRARFEVLCGSYDAESRTMFAYRSPLERVSEVTADEIRKEEFRMRHTVEIPSEAAWLRVAVHDLIGDRIGSVEIPLPLVPEKTNAPR
jgi:VWFA-related protein